MKVTEYIKLLLMTHLKYWYMYLIALLLMPVIVLFLLFIGTGIETNTGNTSLAIRIMTLFFALIMSLFLLIPNTATASKVKNQYTSSNKFLLTLMNHLVSVFVFFVIGVIIFGF